MSSGELEPYDAPEGKLLTVSALRLERTSWCWLRRLHRNPRGPFCLLAYLALDFMI